MHEGKVGVARRRLRGALATLALVAPLAYSLVVSGAP
ncbi:MAG: hypothetical protein K0S65_5852, partial [Labilithrix sp.]|nr:hypothetical protein [Labilithrix sp.]